MLKIKKFLILIAIALFIFTQSAVNVAAIKETPTAPNAPTNQASGPESPLPPQSPSVENSGPQAPNPSSPPQTPINQEESPTKALSNDSSANQSSDDPNTTVATSENNSNNSNSGNGGNVEDTFIQTGNATNASGISTFGNNNLSQSPTDGGNTSLINDTNGSNSENTASSTSANSKNTIQNNNASVGNTLSQTTTTGNNDASQNVGDSVILTGDANTSGTIVTGVNTNFDGISVSEFQVADVHTGDLVLDFAANCIINCTGDMLAKNVGNGANSDNNAYINNLGSDNTFQNNDASVESNLILASNSGQNSASQNTNGGSFIQSGDANVSGNVLTFANNNFAGNVLFGVVDIFGTLNGDIILTDEAIAKALGNNCSTCFGSNINASNTANGSNSDNNVSVNQETNNATLQTNDANIQNNLAFSAATGENTASQNTGGDTFIQTGNSDINAQTINIANSNVIGGNWWLVIVNKAGQWVGQLLGAPVGSLLAGSQGSEFSVNDKGEITATNNGNGTGSQNSSTISQQSNNNTVQTNNANIVNNLTFSANTGGNDASYNTGGSNTIKTGDAKIIANLVNFVNNNIVGGSKLVVTVVNVFGSWFGDFVTPGHQKNNKGNQEESNNLVSNAPIVGGPANSTSSNNSNSENSSSDSSKNNNGNNDNNSGNETLTSTTVSNPPSPSNPSSSPQLLKVAGISNISTADILADIKQNSSKKKNARINLAWALILLPAAAAGVMVGPRNWKRLWRQHPVDN